MKDRLSRYGLIVNRIEKIDLRTCYMQSRPNNPLVDGSENALMINSPHHELASSLIERGEKWTRKNYENTEYYGMCQKMGKKGFPEKMIDLVWSIKDGYLADEYRDEYVICLDHPFAKTRYERDVPELVPEVWSGHHRIGILLALRKYNVSVRFAEDNYPGSKCSEGKIHGLCVEKE